MLFANDTDARFSYSDKLDEKTFLFRYSDTECNKKDWPLYQDGSMNFCNDINCVEISDALR